jgi:hypothetical protein
MEEITFETVQSLDRNTRVLGIVANMNMVEVVGGDGPSVLHSSPLRPWLDRVYRRIPDLLSPDDIFELQRNTIIHDPFSDRCPTRGRHLEAVLANGAR